MFKFGSESVMGRVFAGFSLHPFLNQFHHRRTSVPFRNTLQKQMLLNLSLGLDSFHLPPLVPSLGNDSLLHHTLTKEKLIVAFMLFYTGKLETAHVITQGNNG